MLLQPVLTTSHMTEIVVALQAAGIQLSVNVVKSLMWNYDKVILVCPVSQHRWLAYALQTDWLWLDVPRLPGALRDCCPG